MKRKRVTKEPYEGYTLPKSSEKGVSFVDFNEPYKSKIPVKRVVKIKKRRNKDE
jgi:hypothetical protein